MLARRKTTVKLPENGCPIDKCMAIIGGAWTTHVIWFLGDGPRRFSELKDDIAGISPKMLTERLKKLEASGVISRTVKPTSPPTVEYELTPLGCELKPVLKAIADVGHKLKQKQSEELS